MAQGMDAEAMARLVERYEALTSQQRRGYNEANTRKDFVEPLFEALGWNVRDKQEVDAERLVKPGWADYAFLVEGIPRFFVEAKPLTDDLYSAEYARQVITYAYNKGVTWAVLCNFAGLQVFNAEWETGDLNRARVLNLTCDDYARADSPLRLLSREAFANNELEKQAQAFGGMRPRLPVEKSLYAQIRGWRERLFNGIAGVRPDLTLEQVDEVIERLLNRLIFIRNCEDRRVEEAALRAAVHQWRQPGRRVGLTEAVRGVFADFDRTFDSDLFAFHEIDRVLESQMSQEDRRLQDTLADIVGGLYQPPRSLAAYDFSVIDLDVLGQVYEQYLGHVAQVAKDRADRAERQLRLGVEVPPIELEAKRQRRKEHGIYYTPKWVVDYIVRQTVGRYLEEHSHNDILNVRILDPACGSGSFLTRAFDVLLEYHARVRGKAVLDLDQYDRLRILTANVYGVDLDKRAVDIARLSLLLRAVARRELLPSLAQNVVRGNSLISGTEAELRPYFGDGWREKQPFDWEREFPEIMGRGGFDIVIGNPPYVRIQTVPREEADYYRNHFEAAHGAFDLYVLFMERGVGLLAEGGRLGFITSGKFLKSEYGVRLRKLISERCDVEDVVDLSAHSDVFGEPTSYPVLVSMRKRRAGAPLCYVRVPAGTAIAVADAIFRVQEQHGWTTGQDAVLAGMWPPLSPTTEPLLRKMESAGPPLSAWCEKIFVGLQTSADAVYILRRASETSAGDLVVRSKATDKQHVLERGLLRPLLSGGDVKRYARPDPRRVLLFPYAVEDRRAALISPEEVERGFPRTWEYLVENRERLENREKGKMRHERWYAYVYPKNLGLHEEPKLAVPRLVRKLEAVYDSEGRFYLDNVDVNGILRPSDPYYLLGLLNSELLDFYFRQGSAPFQGDFRSANRQFIAGLPIKRVDLHDPVEKRRHDDLVALVQRMLDLHERLAAKGVLDEERGQIEREIERTDREIDELVYELYGLTEEERRMVEEEVRR